MKMSTHSSLVVKLLLTQVETLATGDKSVLYYDMRRDLSVLVYIKREKDELVPATPLNQYR